MDKIDETRQKLEKWTKDRCPGNLGGGTHGCPANIPSCEDNMALTDAYALVVFEATVLAVASPHRASEVAALRDRLSPIDK